MYSLKDIYPDLAGLNTAEQSIPERTEQASYEQTNKVAPAPATKAGNLWISLLIILALLWLFNII